MFFSNSKLFITICQRDIDKNCSRCRKDGKFVRVCKMVEELVPRPLEGRGRIINMYA